MPSLIIKNSKHMKSPLSIRIPAEIRMNLEAESKRTKRSVSNLIIFILTEYFEKKETK